MPNFEKHQPAPEESPESSSNSNEEAKNALERLVRWTVNNNKKWLATNLLFAVGATDFSAKYQQTKLMERDLQAELDRAEAIQEAESLEVEVRFDQLRELDPEASPERLRDIMMTLPQGFLEGEVEEIGFTDEKYEMPEGYGQELVMHSEGAATAGGGTRAERTVITFWRGAKDDSSKWVWGDAFIHEIGHANDWDTDIQLTESERNDLKIQVMTRVAADDRFHSGYVEAIVNKDAKTQLEIRAKEYWAEIVSAYLGGKPMPEADAAIVKGFIAKQDPGFDHDAALLRRQAVLEDMSVEESIAVYREKLPQEERDTIEAWISDRARIEAEGADPMRERDGRKAFVEAIRRFGTTEEKIKYVITLVDYYAYRDSLFDDRQSGKRAEQIRDLNDLVQEYSFIEVGEEKLGPDAVAFRVELDEIVQTSLMRVGGKKSVLLERGELKELGLDKGKWSLLLVDLVGWHEPAAEPDIIQGYIDRAASFNMPEEE